MTPLTIIKTNPGHSDFSLFEALPTQLYPSDCVRHKQAENINTEFLHQCYVLTVNGKPQARVALYCNPLLRYNNAPAACIGNYEAVADNELSDYLIEFVTKEAKATGACYLIGPMNGSTWDNYRFSANNDYNNFLLEPYHHLYYNQHFTSAGFAPIASYTSSLARNLTFDQPEVLNREEAFKQAGVTIRNIRMNHFEEELKKLFPFITSSFSNNFLYTPISWSTFYKKYTEAAPFINPETVFIAEDKDENIIGFVFCYADLFNTNEKTMVVKTLARKLTKEWSGLGHVLSNQIMRYVSQHQYNAVIHAYMIEDAASTNTSGIFNGKSYKKYMLYGKEI